MADLSKTAQFPLELSLTTRYESSDILTSMVRL